jgi:hypothetical protein
MALVCYGYNELQLLTKMLTLVREDEQDLWTAGVVLARSEVIAALLARNQNF